MCSIVILYLQDLAKVEASIGKFSRQMEVYRIDKDRWMCRFKESRAQLAEAQNTIATLVSINEKLNHPISIQMSKIMK